MSYASVQTKDLYIYTKGTAHCTMEHAACMYSHASYLLCVLMCGCVCACLLPQVDGMAYELEAAGKI